MSISASPLAFLGRGNLARDAPLYNQLFGLLSGPRQLLQVVKPREKEAWQARPKKKSNRSSVFLNRQSEQASQFSDTINDLYG